MRDIVGVIAILIFTGAIGVIAWHIPKVYTEAERDYNQGCEVCGRDHETGDCAW